MKKTLVLFTALLCVTPIYAQQLTDPGPIWQSITDTTSFIQRMENDLAAAEATLDKIRSVKSERTVANTFIPFKKAEYYFLKAQRLARLALNAHPDAAFRKVAQKWESRVAGHAAVLETDPSLYHALKTIDLSEADPSIRYIVGRKLAAFRRNGVQLDEATRKQIADLRAKITAVGTQFERNIFTDVDTIRVHKDSLAGVPPDWIAAHPPDEDGFITTRWTPATARILYTFADNAAIRLLVNKQLASKAYPENLAVIDSLRALRHKLASLLGFSSWAEYAMEPMMAGSPERVRRFIASVSEVSAEAIQQEITALVAIKRTEQPTAVSIDLEDVLYWQNKLKQKTYGFDTQVMREYLPYTHVRDEVLATFERLFGLEFHPAPDIPVWSPAVEAYEVWDDGSLIGRIYLDMHPREGKFGHFAMFPLRNGSSTLPEAALICNFAGGAEGDPGLLTPVRMKTFFHEFGHLIHFILWSQTSVVGDFEDDFVEAPSQLMEEWAQDSAVLASFARHYQTDEPIPPDLIAAYRRSESFGRALAADLRILQAALSLELHAGSSKANPAAAVEERVMAEYFSFHPEWFHPVTAMPHFYRYSSNVYTYLWSAVIAQDLLTAFNQDNLLDPEAGRRYREMILEPTGTAPMDELIEKFLGRPFNAEAWGRWLAGEETMETANEN